MALNPIEGEDNDRARDAAVQPQPCQIRPAGRSAQRHQGGARRPEDSRGAECHGGLILQTPRRTQPRIENHNGLIVHMP